MFKKSDYASQKSILDHHRFFIKRYVQSSCYYFYGKNVNHRIIEIKNIDELEQKKQEENLVIVDFWAPWCGPCKRMDSIFKEIVQEETGFVICKVNIDDHQDFAAQNSIRSIPTFIAFYKGKELEKNVGSMDKETFVQWIKGIKQSINGPQH